MLSLKPLPWPSSTAWHLQQGRLRHMTGGFFSVAGVRVATSIPALDGLVRIIIDQPEIGILGFLVRRVGNGTRTEWLMQAKAEPGNVHAVQLAPSVQATRSNYTRLHGGAPTPYLDFFTGGESGAMIVADGLQSEQGSQFLAKYNRNITVLADGQGPEPCSSDMCWATATDVRAMLAIDFAVNTDARSVLLCSDWRLLAEGEPFARWHGTTGWGVTLLASFAAEGGQTEDGVVQWLGAQRAICEIALELVSLESEPAWRFTDDSITSRQDDRPLVRLYDIHVNNREVDQWDQPLVLGHGEGSVVQLCQRRHGVLGFLLRASVEIGFREWVQLGPTWQSDDLTGGNGAADRIIAVIRNGRQRCSTLQSDEGGRFYRSISRYRIIELDESVEIDVEACGYLWLNLGQVYRLLPRQGIFTNEARSVLSMLLVDL